MHIFMFTSGRLGFVAAGDSVTCQSVNYVKASARVRALVQCHLWRPAVGVSVIDRPSRIHWWHSAIGYLRSH